MLRQATALAILLAFGTPGCFTSASEISPWDAGGSSDVDGTSGVDGTSDVGAPQWPNACSAADPCTQQGTSCQSEAVCVPNPAEGTEATLTDPADDLPEPGEAVNLACVGQEPVAPAGPETAELFGAVARFGSGGLTDEVLIEVFDAAAFDPKACEAEETLTQQQECYANYGTPLGSDVSELVDVPEAELPASCEREGSTGVSDHSKCPLGYRCIEQDLDWKCVKQFGLYAIDNVPTNTRLVLRATAQKSPAKWHVSYAFNVYLYADQVDADGRFHYDATIVHHGQWLLTPNTVSLPDIPEDRGVLGGRIRDCRTDSRDSWAVADVTLGLAQPAKKIVFFNNLEDDTVPLADRGATNVLGRFAALDIEPGWNQLVGAVRIGGEIMTLGVLDVYVFPNSLTTVSYPGLQPHWSQQ